MFRSPIVGAAVTFLQLTKDDCCAVHSSADCLVATNVKDLDGMWIEYTPPVHVVVPSSISIRR